MRVNVLFCWCFVNLCLGASALFSNPQPMRALDISHLRCKGSTFILTNKENKEKCKQII